MSELGQLKLLAAYNQLMNQRLYAAADRLNITDLHEDKGAFFGSVMGTLNHILVGDIIWLKRFAVHPACSDALSYISGLKSPASLDALLFDDLDDLYAERQKVDEIIVQWLWQLPEAHLSDCVSYYNMAGKLFSKPLLNLINHLFLHQVHHRGQVTTLLSQSDVDFGDTDLIEIIDECSP